MSWACFWSKFRRARLVDTVHILGNDSAFTYKIDTARVVYTQLPESRIWQAETDLPWNANSYSAAAKAAIWDFHFVEHIGPLA